MISHLCSWGRLSLFSPLLPGQVIAIFTPTSVTALGYRTANGVFFLCGCIRYPSCHRRLFFVTTLGDGVANVFFFAADLGARVAISVCLYVFFSVAA